MDVCKLKVLPAGESDGTTVCVKVNISYYYEYCFDISCFSGIMKTGLNAIMGATGSDKTSLLDVFAGRKDPCGFRSGQVLVDKKVVTSDLRLMSAYVVQDDILMGTLTVRENFLFSGNVRLPRKQYSTADKKKNIIQELGLEDCADTKIGTEIIRGVSGGERKRCSIGMELITSPTLLFLDEPTTGLDSNTANSIIALLHRYKLVSILITLHHPSYYPCYSIFSLGKTYNIGYAFNNPADFFLDITNGETSSAMPTEKSLAELYRESHNCAAVKEELKCITGPSDPSSEAKSKAPSYVTSFFHEKKYFCHFQVNAFFFLIINMVFGNLSAVELFINEEQSLHENSGGYYRTSVNFLSKVFVDLLPNRIVPIFIFSCISYYMMGLNPAFTAFLCFALTMSMVSLAGVSLAFLVSASVSSFAMANILIALPFVFMMVFGGFLVNLNSMLSWLSWLKWASVFKYGLYAVTINEMKGQSSTVAMLKGEMYLQSQGIDYSLCRINRWK
uniref:ABC transporter domain-containing protein n=1 Tax=Sinocyclocheilus grahami TaxID=75366 RepID=A0A672MI76_SINGR